MTSSLPAYNSAMGRHCASAYATSSERVKLVACSMSRCCVRTAAAAASTVCDSSSQTGVMVFLMLNAREWISDMSCLVTTWEARVVRLLARAARGEGGEGWGCVLRRDVRDAAPLLVEPMVGKKHGVVNHIQHTWQWPRAHNRASLPPLRARRAHRLRGSLQRGDVRHAVLALRDGHIVII
ncbi:hypothetical protein T492DRAFT_997803 [Pavlovales sp. CCMP2436]|nr:hypothetical protein T492DRAFT_997803 [Pavlovales sp. CCMP2436]